jgi:hypothetical protein
MPKEAQSPNAKQISDNASSFDHSAFVRLRHSDLVISEVRRLVFA